jgi:hypothetical protein
MESDPAAHAEAIGRRNAEILELAARWCRHITLDRSHTGTGVVEQSTGLPVSGGEFRCDYAARRVGSVMRLELSAVDFYEANCVGCAMRAAADIPPHLGSYADAVITQRKREDAQQAQALQRQADEAVTRRAARRALVTETPGTSFVLSLLDGLDQAETSADAAQLLDEQVRIDPDPVAAALPALVDPATVPQADAVLDALNRLDEAGLVADTSPVVALALRAVTEGWGPAGGRILARHAEADHIETNRLIQQLILIAAPVRDFTLRREPTPEPAALLAYLAIDSRKVAAILATELRHGDDGRRSCAAGAAHAVLSEHPELLATLLPGILDGLRLQDRDRYSMTHPTARLQICLALALSIDPDLVEGRIASRWANATPAYRSRMLDGYQRALSSYEDTQSRPPEAAISAALSRASVILTETIPPLSDPLNTNAQETHRAWAELQRTAAEIISTAARLGGSGASVETLLGIVLLLLHRDSEAESAQQHTPADPTLAALAQMQRHTERQQLDSLMREVTEALAERARYDREQWWNLLQQTWENTDSSDPLRAQLIKAATLVAISDPAELHKPVPYIFGSLTGPTARLRAAALKNLGKLAQHGLVLPVAVLETAWELRLDSYLAVTVTAVNAFPRLYRQAPAGAPRLADVATWLLSFAHVYATDPVRGDIVRNALDHAISLSIGQAWEVNAWRASMAVIREMHAYDAGEALNRVYPWDSCPIDEWAPAVVTALRLDTRPGYGGLQDHGRDKLLRPFLRVPREDLGAALTETSLGPAITEIAKTYLPGQATDAYAVADILARGDVWPQAQEVADAVLATIPDVPATHGWHLEAAYRSARCRVEAAIAAGRRADADHALSMAAQYENELQQLGATTMKGWPAARRELIEILRQAASGSPVPDELDQAAGRLTMLEPRGLAAGRVGGYQQLLRALADAMRWRPAALAADHNPERFLRAARERATGIYEGSYDEELRQLSTKLIEFDSYEGVPGIAQALAAVVLPPALSDLAPVRPARTQHVPTQEPTQPPAIAVQVDIQAPEAGNAVLLDPSIIAAINVAVNVPAWPADADSLDISFASTLTPAMLHISPIALHRGQTAASGHIQITGHLPMLARPAEITVNATFRGDEFHEAAHVLTNPTVRIVTTDPQFGLANLPRVQETLRTILTQLQVLHPVWAGSTDARDAVLLLSGLIRFAHHLTDETAAATPEAMDEATFQRRLKEFLRADQNIGARLQEAPRAAGGITDLVLGETVLELKVEPDEPVTADTARTYLAQPTTYASSRDRVVSILGILDESPKDRHQARTPIGDNLTWFTPPTHGQSQQHSPAAAIACILSRRFPRPSDLSH